MATVPKKEKRYTKSTKHIPLDKDNGNHSIGNLEVGHTVKLGTDKRVVFDRKAENLTVNDKISADTLPSLNSIEDVFKTMGVWEKAVALHKKGLTWS